MADESEGAAQAGSSKIITWIPGTKSKGKKKRPSHIPRVATAKREEIEVTQLQKRVDSEAPPVGSQEATAEAFSDLPLSSYTQKGRFLSLLMNQNHFETTFSVQCRPFFFRIQEND